ncbi:MAG: ketopantoate reductase family protein [Parashewanella sp.]
MTNIGIIGAGAIGQLIGFQLQQAGEKISYVVRQAVDQPSRCTFNDLSQVSHTYQPQFRVNSDPALANIDLLIVCVKAYQVLSSLKPLLPNLNAHCHILLLHNGLGTHNQLIPLLQPTQGLSIGTTSQSAVRLIQWQVEQTGEGLTQFGHCAGIKMTEALKTQLLQAIPHSQWTDDIMVALWSKLAVNCVINPLTAIYRCHNGGLAKTDYQHQCSSIVTELLQLAKLEGIGLVSNQIEDRVKKVVELTANNYSSMYQDVVHHRETEIDYINGYLVKLAQKHNISVPENQKLVEQIKSINAFD